MPQLAACVQDLVDLISLCLNKDPNDRPGAAQLLKHRFLKVGRSTALPIARLALVCFVLSSARLGVPHMFLVPVGAQVARV